MVHVRVAGAVAAGTFIAGVVLGHFFPVGGFGLVIIPFGIKVGDISVVEEAIMPDGAKIKGVGAFVEYNAIAVVVPMKEKIASKRVIIDPTTGDLVDGVITPGTDGIVDMVLGPSGVNSPEAIIEEVPWFLKQAFGVHGPGPTIPTSPAISCDPPSGSILAALPYPEQHFITCTATAGGLSETAKIPISIHRFDDTSAVTDGTPDTFNWDFGLPTWVEVGSFAPVKVERSSDGNTETIKVLNAGLSAEYVKSQGNIGITLFDPSFADSPTSDPDRIIESWDIDRDQGGIQGKTFEGFEAYCTVTDTTTVQLGEVMCNVAEVVLRYSVTLTSGGSAEYVVGEAFLGDGRVKTSMSFGPLDGEWIPKQILQIKVDEVSDEDPVEADSTETLIRFANAGKLAMSISNFGDISFDLEPEMPTPDPADEDRTTFTLSYGAGLDAAGVTPFQDGFNIDPYQTSGIPVYDSYLRKASITGTITHYYGATSLRTGEQPESNCGTGTGGCIHRAIYRWDISAITIPAPSQLTSIDIKLLYQTWSFVGTLPDGQIYPIKDATLSVSDSTTSQTDLNNAWIDAADTVGPNNGDGTETSGVYLNSWTPAQNTIYNCSPTCQLLGTGETAPVVDDFRDKKDGVGSNENKFAIGVETDDGFPAATSEYYRQVYSEDSSASQKQKLRITYTCANGSTRTDCL